MTTTLNVPELGESITSAFIAKWLKQVGEPVAKGESMVELDSDKASLEVPSPAAGVVEELLFRGYTITRLTMLTRNVWVAGVLALVGFAFLHAPYWGRGFVVISLIGGVVTTSFFIWKKDLLAMMVFHACTDAVGLVIAPMFSEWWREPRAF